MATQMTREDFRKLSGTSTTTQAPAQESRGFLETVRDIVPGKEIGESLVSAGTNLFNLATGGRKKFMENLPDNQVDVPRLIGDYTSAGAIFAPAGGASAGISSKIAPVVGRKLAPILGASAAGGTVGYVTDVANKLRTGEGAGSFTPGLGTAIGAALPVAGAGINALRAGARQASGIATGVGGGVVDEASKAVRAGGAEAQAFREGLRGGATPEQIRIQAGEALGNIIQQRGAAYRNQLAKLQGGADDLDTGPVVSKVYEELANMGVTKNGNRLDFSRAPGLERYKNDVIKLVNTIERWGTKEGDNTILGVDTLKRTIDQFRRGTEEAATFDRLVTATRNASKDLGRGNAEYAKLLDDYESTSNLIKNIRQDISLGDKSNFDTGVRKLTSVLRTNNEFRRQLVDELNAVSGGTLIPRIAGQQMSELAPRGLARAVGGIGAVGGLATGVGVVPVIKAALFTSPRLAGEVINALGYTGKAAAPIINAINGNAAKVPWEVIFPGEEEPENYRDSSLESRPEYDATSNSSAGTQNQSQMNPANQGVNSDQSIKRMTREEFRAMRGM